MKQTNKVWMTVSSAIVIILILTVFNIPGCSHNTVPVHKCIDSTHKECDGQCECDGFECK
jgi:hypothetical protein